MGAHRISNHPVNLLRKIVYARNYPDYEELDNDIAVICWKDPVDYSDEVSVRTKSSLIFKQEIMRKLGDRAPNQYARTPPPQKKKIKRPVHTERFRHRHLNKHYVDG